MGNNKYVVGAVPTYNVYPRTSCSNPSNSSFLPNKGCMLLCAHVGNGKDQFDDHVGKGKDQFDDQIPDQFDDHVGKGKSLDSSGTSQTKNSSFPPRKGNRHSRTRFPAGERTEGRECRYGYDYNDRGTPYYTTFPPSTTDDTENCSPLGIEFLLPTHFYSVSRTPSRHSANTNSPLVPHQFRAKNPIRTKQQSTALLPLVPCP